MKRDYYFREKYNHELKELKERISNLDFTPVKHIETLDEIQELQNQIGSLLTVIASDEEYDKLVDGFMIQNIKSAYLMEIYEFLDEIEKKLKFEIETEER